MAKKRESVHSRRLKEIEAEKRKRHSQVDQQVKNREALRRAADPNSPERLMPAKMKFYQEYK